MLNAIMLNVIMHSVEAPKNMLKLTFFVILIFPLAYSFLILFIV